jgi:hypothetical protein
MKPSEILDAYGWCKETFAVDRHGEGIHPNNPDAVRFCAEGALIRAYPKAPTKRERILNQLLPLIQKKKGLERNSIIDYNDHIAKDKRYLIRLFRKIGQ